MVRHLNHRLRDAGVRNVVTVLSDPDDPLLPDTSVFRLVAEHDFLPYQYFLVFAVR